MAENAHIHAFWINETEKATDREKGCIQAGRGQWLKSSLESQFDVLETVGSRPPSGMEAIV